MTRVERLAENSLIKRITDLREQFDALKNSQRAGSTAVAVRRIVTGSNIDFTITATYHVINEFEITFTYADASFTNTTFFWRIFYNVITSSGTGTAQVYTELLSAEVGRRRARFYIMGMSPSNTITYGVRVVIYAIGSGSISIVQIL